jgi:hypothetical protein
MIPDVAILSHVYLMPPRLKTWSEYMDGTMAKSINLDDEVSMASQALSDPSNSQSPEKKAEKGLHPFDDTRCRAWRGTLGD